MKKKRKKPMISILSDEGFELIEHNHLIKTSHHLYSCGANLEDKACCRIALTVGHFHPSVIERHLENSMELAKEIKARLT